MPKSLRRLVTRPVRVLENFYQPLEGFGQFNHLPNGHVGDIRVLIQNA
jgi:hypothetical protein